MEPTVHLCGSVPLADSETVFCTVANTLNGRVRRIPDGEPGERDNWVVWQLPKLAAHPDLETVPPPGREYGPTMRVRPRPGVDPASVTFGPLGYAAAALDSWQVFRRLRADGVIPPDVRFQVSLPTPVAVVAAFVGAHQAELEAAYEARLLAELEEILAVIPAGDLAVQWDTAVEFAVFEGVYPAWFGTDHPSRLAEIVTRLVRLGTAVPDEAELGYHLCYGDFEHRHFVEPPDTSKLAAVTRGVADGLGRRLDWVHMPVPRDRADEAYFAPLATLSLPAETTLFLGLVHATDGLEGAAARIEAARGAVKTFGVATECGMGRRPPEQIPALLALHASVADLL
ncbi:hypothetical protein [Actinomadura citrea]|uniref:Uncharacterized protein n=1 Tax=Actinomadura citrea TaxID=46158 RepID=A0A7Y9KBK1_9ACTN|nr:hypothetical protein [Actinomadura citrea]NYE10073.1 hypothetical protein [Actinomadura citrea]GGT69804.1 hypothetical protein GCM10010177_29080 [Actinomadura citrea]